MVLLHKLFFYLLKLKMNMFDVCFTEQFMDHSQSFLKQPAKVHSLSLLVSTFFPVAYFYFNTKQSHLLLTFDWIVKPLKTSPSRANSYLKNLDFYNKTCNMGWLVDGKGRLRVWDHYLATEAMYFLELHWQRLVCSCRWSHRQKSGTKPYVRDSKHNAQMDYWTDNQYSFTDLIHCIESRRPGLMLARVFLGQGPALVLSSGRRNWILDSALPYLELAT